MLYSTIYGYAGRVGFFGRIWHSPAPRQSPGPPFSLPPTTAPLIPKGSDPGGARQLSGVIEMTCRRGSAPEPPPGPPRRRKGRGTGGYGRRTSGGPPLGPF